MLLQMSFLMLRQKILLVLGVLQITSKGNVDIIRFDTNVISLGAGAYTVCDILPHNYSISYGIACLMVGNTCVGFASLMVINKILVLVTSGYAGPVTIQGTVMSIRQ